ncbi:uncharacterized protein B0H18DRAFT_1209607 [Fomitopsis serialis]|uniref:uncharacterized protein n=1 Tax=Fomitopsis serialis TaxID=139415 RepID=UPI002007FFB1|nr:uncharacterized protein B0H18DRAFT_1209607 [Neoantrodia serialis]KAH9930115.1 hypothetical protein B0H18DRAFT_1209607 [Neoantrodia serialis]
MSPPMSPSSSFSSSASWTEGSSESSISSDFPPSPDMQGTPSKKKSSTGITQHEQTLQSSQVNKDSWASEIDGKISLFDRTLPEFFQHYVPCESPFPGDRPWREASDVFGDVPVDGKETAKYPELLSGLRRLVREFEPKRRPLFADGSRCPIRFPFDAWEDEHNYTMPDILMSFPGVRAKKWAGSWQGISMVFEIKRTSGEDPIGKYAVKPGKQETGVLTQLAKSARNLLLTHGMLFMYIVGIYGDIARIYRVDHAACVVSRSFDIKKRPWPLHELLWRFCHYQAPQGGVPGAPLTNMLLGADPSVQQATERDVKLAENQGVTTDEQAYLIYRIRSLNPRLFSRATIVWDALEEGTWERCAIKDAWRQLARDREDVLYDQIRGAFRDRPWRELLEDYLFMHSNDGPEGKPSIPTGPFQVDEHGCVMLPPEIEEMLVDAELDPMVAELYGLPETSYSDDLGAREADKALHPDSGVAGARDGLISTANNPDRPPVYGHRTICGSLRGPQRAVYDERGHMRLVMKTVGRPLSAFKSTKELVHALRDAIIGHRQAYQAGVIHRDVSEGNVMICDTRMAFFVGFLLDFDYGFDWKAALMHAGFPVNEANWKMFVEKYNESLTHPVRPGPPEKIIPFLGPHTTDGSPHTKAAREQWEARMKMKERTGTLFFMAVEILETYLAHDVRHDLESFFWLLLWIVLRHTNHTSYPTYYSVYLKVFAAQDGADSAARKRQFLQTRMAFEVKDNKPLMNLIRDFKRLCRHSIPLAGDDPSTSTTVPLTYESVLAVFDTALADPSWPTNDAALPFKLPRNVNGSQPGQDDSEGSQDKKRARDADDMEHIEEEEDDDDPFKMHQRAPKRPQIACPGLSSLRFELGEAGPSH